MTDLTNWRQLSDQRPALSDHGPDLVLCLDFPGGRAVAGFAELAAGVPLDSVCFLHIGKTGDGSLTDWIDRWTAEITATSRSVRAVFGFCAATGMATRLADAIAGDGPPPMVVLFDAIPTTSESVAHQFTAALESSAEHLTADELAEARDLAEQLAATYPDDLPRIVAAMAARYDQLMRAVADRLSLHEFLRKELTDGFTAYLHYLLLASEGGFDMRTTTPLFVWSPGHEPPVEGARDIALDIDHADLLRAPEVHKLVAGLLTGEHPW